MTEVKISPKAQVILSWLRDPTTKRYIEQLLLDEKNLSLVAVESMNQAISSGLLQRSEDEIRTFNRIKAIRTLLSSIPYQSSLREGDLTEEDVKELENFFEQLPN